MQLNDFVLDHIFHKITTKDGEIIYWRSCILKEDMVQGDQGYIIVYSDGTHHHTYSYPPSWINQ